jgi:hypothetical protein
MQAAPRHRKSFAPSARTFVALLAVCVAWLVALSQGANTLHFALISHEICADHGELVHTDADAHASEHRVPGPAVQAPSEHAGHDHCPVLGRPLEQAGLSGAPPATLAALAVTAPAPAAVETDNGPSRAELLLAAPKQSPPV